MLSITQVIQLYFSGITVVLFLAMFSLLLCRHVGEVQRKVLPMFGFVILGFLTAIPFTKGNTSLWPPLVLVVIGLLYRGERSDDGTSKTMKETAYLVGLFTFFFFLMFLVSTNASGDVIVSNYDTPFYVRLVEYLMLTGNEQYWPERLFPEENGVWLYHYLEHWVAAFIKMQTPNIPTIFSFDLVLNPLLFSLSTLGFFHLIKAASQKTTISVYFLAPIIVFGVAIPGIIEFLPDGVPFNLNRSWSPIEQPKSALVYLFLSPIILAVHHQNLRLTWVMSLLLGTCFIPTIPAVTISSLLFTIYVVIVHKTNWQYAIKITVQTILVASIGLGTWLVFNPGAESFENRMSIDIITSFYQHHFVGILGVSLISTLVVFLPAILLLVRIRRFNLEMVLFILFLYMSGLFSYALLGFEFQSFQLFQAISIPSLTILFLLLATNVLLNKTVSWFKFAVFFFLSYVAFVRINDYGFVLARAEEIAELNLFVTEKEVRTAFIRSPKEFEGAVVAKHPYLYFPVEQLHAISATYHSFSLNELSWEIASELYAEEYRYRQFSSFCRFVEHQGLQREPIEVQQSNFLADNDIHYLEVSALADIRGLDINIVDSLTFQDGSRLYKID